MTAVASSERLCRRLLEAPTAQDRHRLLEQAVRRAECLAFALERAKTAQHAEPNSAPAWSDLAVELADRRDDPRAGASAWRARAQALRRLGQHPEAIAAHRTAADRALLAGDALLAAQVRLGEIDSLGMLGRADEALALARRLEAEFRAVGAHEDAAKALVNAGNLYFRGDQYPQALDCYERAQAAIKEAETAALALARRNAPASAASARFLLADIGLAAGEDVSRRLHAVSRAARRHARGWLVCRAERALGVFYAGRGDTRRAITHFRAGVAALEEAHTLIASEDLHLAFLSDKLVVYEDLAGALLTRGRPQDIVEALDCVERAKSRLLLERMQTALSGSTVPGTSSPAHQRLAALRAELSRSYHRLYATEVGVPQRLTGEVVTPERLALLEQSYIRELRDHEITNQGPGAAYVMHAQPAPAECLRRALGPDETLVEYFKVGETLGAFVLTRETIRVQRNIARMSDVVRLVRRLRHQLQRAELDSDYVRSHKTQMYAGIETVLREMHALLVAPLCDLLTNERIVMIPHGVLRGLPFHAFHDGNDYLLSRYEFVYAPSAAIWYTGARRGRASEAQAMERNGQFDLLAFGVSGPYISHVTEEVEQIAGLFPNACTYKGSDATLVAFRSVAGRAGRIHLATHALFRADNPLFSGLKLADGWLLARDLYDLPLDCDLATLSACRTGASSVGPGDELLGLSRGFLGAGARSVAASLWPADDDATATLMVRFYELLNQGVSRAAALRAAQRATRDEYPHPYHWAAFILIGER